MTIGFGLDLAGYTTNRTRLSVVEKTQDAKLTATILYGTVFSHPHNSGSPLAPILKQEVDVINQCVKFGSFAVDVPIDLQSLLSPIPPKEIWELTCRPVDRQLRGLRPLADRLGSAVARFKVIMATGGFKPVLGKTLFETYPAASLRALQCSTGHYKQDTEAGQQSRSDICKSLRLEGATDLSHDEIDSIICALTVLAPTDKPPIPAAELPRGYILLGRPYPFVKVVVKRKDFSEWYRNKVGND